MQTHDQLPHACKVLFSFKLYVFQILYPCIIWTFVECILIFTPAIYFALFVAKLFTFKYRVIQEESALLWDMIVWVIISKKVHRTWVQFWTVMELWAFLIPVHALMWTALSEQLASGGILFALQALLLPADSSIVQFPYLYTSGIREGGVSIVSISPSASTSAPRWWRTLTGILSLVIL